MIGIFFAKIFNHRHHFHRIIQRQYQNEQLEMKITKKNYTESHPMLHIYTSINHLLHSHTQNHNKNKIYLAKFWSEPERIKKKLNPFNIEPFCHHLKTNRFQKKNIACVKCSYTHIFVCLCLHEFDEFIVILSLYICIYAFVMR